MAVTTFIPTIWSARLLAHLDASHVYANLLNRDYEGEIRGYGSTVKINQVGEITVKDYVRNGNLEDPEELSTEDQTLTIDQSKYFNFQLDDVDKAQIRAALMDAAMQRAAYALSDVSDRFAADLLAKGAGNKIGTTAAPITLTKDNAYEQLVVMKNTLDKKNVPSAGRWVVVPPEFEGLMLLDQRFVGTGGTRAEETLTNGAIARAAGFTIYKSNNTPVTSGKYSILAGYNGAATYAEQIVETEAYRMEKRFADAVKGLHVYGAKVTRPETLVLLTASFTASAS
ncbi:P22 phage major capsid protein family protein [Clostridium sp. D33t1_170424_F3]|uniref:P22 phage major capsid protein family protein n=1 Tax=Clostridium sp. D33t1_170424_F3 TaxID=2787099 RepID=UPI0018A8E18D|nr:P22 phage major capsid protein family protein [Clostridium sp. D33t1_170424_F3]